MPTKVKVLLIWEHLQCHHLVKGITMITTIIQARTGSTRLPKKVLALIEGKPMLECVVRRTQQAKLVESVIVATTAKRDDMAIIQLADKMGIICNLGDENDVLSRYYETAKMFRADPIIRITSDCPLIDPEIIDKTVDYYLKNDFDYVTNPGYPDGLDVEVFSFKIIKELWNRPLPYEHKEHVTSFIVDNPKLYKIGKVKCEHDLSHYHWSVDTMDDLRFVRHVYSELGKDFRLKNILEMLK